MPNWCQNRLEVGGPAEELDRFDAAFRSRPAPWLPPEYELVQAGEGGLADFLAAQKARWEQYASRHCFHALYPVPPEVILTGYSAFYYSRRQQLLIRAATIWCRLFGFPEVALLAALLGRETDGYHWCQHHWGTKWDVYQDVQADFGPDWAEYSFDTAWRPPLGWLTRVSRDWPCLTFTLAYLEPGVGFVGQVEIQSGEVVRELYADCSVSGNRRRYEQLAWELFRYDPFYHFPLA